MLQKLALLGIGGDLLGWLHQFLVGRVMQVVVDGSRSDCKTVHSGVPQGSVLGPLLFIAFVNHLTHGLSSQCKVFADDLKLYFPMRDSAPISGTGGQEDIDIIYTTAVSWGLKLNASKCSVLRFGASPTSLPPVYTVGGQLLPLVPFSLDLGVMIDDSMKFHRQVDQVVRKASGLSANILRSTCNRQPLFMRELFVTHIRPIMDYASCLWNTGYVGDLRKLESIQRRWTKRISGLESQNYDERLRALDLYSVKGRLLRADLIKVWKIFQGKSSISPNDIFSISPLINTRGHCLKLSHERCRLAARQRFFSVRVVSLWNSLSEEVVLSETVESFKRGLHRSLGSVLFSFED